MALMECPFEDDSLPEVVRDSLLDFAVCHILEAPGDFEVFGLKHFIEAYAYRQSKAAEESDGLLVGDVILADPSCPLLIRRNGVLFTVEQGNQEKRDIGVKMPSTRKLKIKLYLLKTFPFKYLDESLVDAVLDRMLCVSVKAGDTIFHQGDTVLNFFVIESGIYEERVLSGGRDILLYEYDSWGCFQTASLVSPNAAQSTFVAKTDGLLWAISCTEFRAIASRHDKASFTAKSLCLHQLTYLSDLPSADMDKLVDGVDFLRFKKGEFIIKGTAESNGLYKVLSGKVSLREKSISGKATNGFADFGQTKTVGPGDSFGDLTMFCHRLNGTRAIAQEPCEVLCLSASAFERLLGPFNKYFVAGGVWNTGIAKMRCGHWDWLPLHGELADLVEEYKSKKPEDFLKFGWEYYRSKSAAKLQAVQISFNQMQRAKLDPGVKNTWCAESEQFQQQSKSKLAVSSRRPFKLLKTNPGKELDMSQTTQKILPKGILPPVMNHPLQLHVLNLQNRPAVPGVCHEWGDCLPEMIHSPLDSGVSLDNLTYTVSEETPSKHQWRKLSRVLKSVPIFKAMGDHGINETIRAMQLVKIYPGHYITKSMNIGTHFYVIEEGNYKVLINGVGVIHEILDSPVYFGELGLILDVPRFADVVATTDGKVWAISRERFRKIADTVPVGKRGLNYKLVKTLGGLEELKDYDFKALSLTLETTTFKDREILCGFGDEPAGVFFVKQGTVRVFSRTLKNKSAIIKKGESFGCLKFSVGESEGLKAQSIGRSKVARLPLSSFEKLLDHCRQVLYQNKCFRPT